MSAKPAISKKPLTPVSNEEPIGNYFTSHNKKGLTFIGSGCKLLDCSLGGGWPLGKMSNIIGDKSSGKSLLAIEAMTNCILQFPKSEIFYLEAEAGFDMEYAGALGLPTGAVNFVGEEELEDFTIESWYDHINDVLDTSNSSQPMLYIVDSLDAMSDRAELDREITDKSYNMTKQKKIGELFRRLTKKIEKSQMHLMIISQIRDNIGVTFGAKHSRSGGKAMDFYASQILWLSGGKQIKKTVKKVERTVGIDILTECKKNKVGLPFRKSAFKILFGYGIDDIASMVEWLKEVGALEEFINPITNEQISEKRLAGFANSYKTLSKADRTTVKLALEKVVLKKWQEIEESFLPKSSKY